MEEIVQEIKKEKKKIEISDEKILIPLSIFFVLNVFLLFFLITFENNQIENSNPYRNSIEILEKEEETLKQKFTNDKYLIACEEEEQEEEVRGKYVDVQIEFYSEIKDPLKIPEICTECVIREVGVVKTTSTLPKELIGMKYLVVVKKAQQTQYMYNQVDRLLVNDDYSVIYSFINISSDAIKIAENPNYSEEYYPDLITNLIPDALLVEGAFKSDKGYYFVSGYEVIFGDEYEFSDLTVEKFDTYKGYIIYVNKENPNLYYAESKEHFLVPFQFVPSIHIRDPLSEPYPITWEGNIKNTSYFDYGYDVCGGIGLRSTDISLDEIKITGYRTGTDEPIYEYINKERTELKKIYEEDYLKYIYEYEEKPEGKPKLTYDEFIALHPVIFWEDETGRMLMFYNTRFVMQGGCAKPIVYLYPQKETDITVQVVPATGYLTFTYPKYDGAWKVTSNKDGVIKDSEGTTYEYLWWESKSDYLPKTDKGFVVQYENLDIFFNLILKKAGFNQKEINDFKEFWVPTMTNEYTPYFKISFLQNEEVDTVANLLINPAPNTEIRLFMIYERLNSYVKIDNQDIQNTPRKGFVVTEWGGTRR